jgi:hypothetical protein
LYFTNESTAKAIGATSTMQRYKIQSKFGIFFVIKSEWTSLRNRAMLTVPMNAVRYNQPEPQPIGHNA